MSLTHTLRGLLIAALALMPIIASASQKKCTPGSYWSERDQMCIWPNDR